MIVAVSVVRDEADIIERTVRHLFNEGVDRLVVADNRSVDGTRDILVELAREYPMTVLDDPEPGFYQSSKMTALAELAGGLGATWVVPFDADEMWMALEGPLAATLDQSPWDVELAVTFEVRPDGAVAAEPKRLHKVAVRYVDGMRIHDGNHEADHPGRRHLGSLMIHEYQWRSLEQVRRKVRQGTAALITAGLPESSGAHWRTLAALDDDELAAWWAAYTGVVAA